MLISIETFRLTEVSISAAVAMSSPAAAVPSPLMRSVRWARSIPVTSRVVAPPMFRPHL